MSTDATRKMGIFFLHHREEGSILSKQPGGVYCLYLNFFQSLAILYLSMGFINILDYLVDPRVL